MSIVRNAVYVDGVRHAAPTSLERTYEAMAETSGMGWIDLRHPTREEIESIAAQFHLHHLVVEGTTTGSQRPKIERYADVLLTVVHPARYLDEQETVEFGELHIVTGRSLVLSIQYTEWPDLEVVRQRLEGSPNFLARGPDAVLYAILDQVIDDYDPVVAGLANDVDEVEFQVFDGDPGVSRRIYGLLRQAIEFQRAVEPLTAMLDALQEWFDEHPDDDLRRHLRVVEDHHIKVVERVRGLRSLLEGILSVHATLVGQRQSEQTQRLTEAQFAQNEGVRKISSWAAVMFAPTLIAGVYGMNFTNMPELDWRLGYPFALALMIGGSTLLYVLFKRRGWL